MIALAFALALSAADDLPRTMTLEEFRVPATEPAAKEDMAFFAGVHLGVAGAFDADNPCFVFGGNGRVHNLFHPMIGADVSIDFQTKQEVQDVASIFQIPFMFTGLFYPPLGDLPIRPYAQMGFGFTITDVTVKGGKDDNDLNLLFHFGFGVEYELAENLLLDANLRFVFATDPPGANALDFDAHWIQFTVGIMIKLSK
jgi:hypothetical protein